MATQAQRVLAHTSLITSYIDPSQYKDIDTLEGTISEGGALWTQAQILFPDSVWDHIPRQIVFADNSAIQFIPTPTSSFTFTYKAVIL